jgi:hypothetical protein
LHFLYIFFEFYLRDVSCWRKSLALEPELKHTVHTKKLWRTHLQYFRVCCHFVHTH